MSKHNFFPMGESDKTNTKQLHGPPPTTTRLTGVCEQPCIIPNLPWPRTNESVSPPDNPHRKRVVVLPKKKPPHLNFIKASAAPADVEDRDRLGAELVHEDGREPLFLLRGGWRWMVRRSVAGHAVVGMAVMAGEQEKVRGRTGGGRQEEEAGEEAKALHFVLNKRGGLRI